MCVWLRVHAIGSLGIPERFKGLSLPLALSPPEMMRRKKKEGRSILPRSLGGSREEVHLRAKRENRPRVLGQIYTEGIRLAGGRGEIPRQLSIIPVCSA